MHHSSSGYKTNQTAFINISTWVELAVSQDSCRNVTELLEKPKGDFREKQVQLAAAACDGLLSSLCTSFIRLHQLELIPFSQISTYITI